MASEGIPPQQKANPDLFPEGKVYRYDHTWAEWDDDRFFDEFEELCEAHGAGYLDCLEICADWKEENEKLKEVNEKLFDEVVKLKELTDSTTGHASCLSAFLEIRKDNEKLKDIDRVRGRIMTDLHKRIEELMEENKKLKEGK